jgi:DNA-binding NarL/FixJ family response regulator
MQQRGVVTVAEAGTGSAAAVTLAAVRPDIALIGSLPDLAPAMVLRRLVAASPGTRCMVLADAADPRADAVALLKAGATAVVPRTATVEELCAALDRLLLGQRYVGGLPGRALAAADGDASDTVLSPRERAVLARLVTGASNREIANALFIGTETVKTHLRSIYAKLGVANRQEAIRAALARDIGL